jgi:hypothetical protein
VVGRQITQHAAVLPHTVVALKLCDTALIHVGVMNAVARLKSEVFITLVGLGPPAFAKA